MAKNPKKGPFDLSVDLEKIPSFRSRFSSMDRLTSSPIDMSCDEYEHYDVENPNKLKERLASGQDVRSNPSVILRRKGIRV